MGRKAGNHNFASLLPKFLTPTPKLKSVLQRWGTSKRAPLLLGCSVLPGFYPAQRAPSHCSSTACPAGSPRAAKQASLQLPGKRGLGIPDSSPLLAD